MSSSTSSSGGGSGGSSTTADPWSWLGLLKWSLAYSDGTTSSSDNTPPAPMSDEDKAFLEKVMKEGIINENERMKEILKQMTNLMEQWKQQQQEEQQHEQVVVVMDLLQELRDIVEQIDYARAFAAMKGLDFLLGCIQERQVIPRSVRLLCLGLIATLCQNNPPVQKELLELGSIRILSELFFQEQKEATAAVAVNSSSGNNNHNNSNRSNDPDGQLRARIVQAISANVRSFELGEAVFCQLDQAVALLELGLGVKNDDDDDNNNNNSTVPIVLQKRTLFLLRALLTSDASTRERVRLFQSTVCGVADHLVAITTTSSSSTTAGHDTTLSSSSSLSSLEIREVSLELIQGILEQKKSVNAVLSRKDALVNAGVQRVAAIRDGGLSTTRAAVATAEAAAEASEDDDDWELLVQRREVELWESVIALLARAEPDDDDDDVPMPSTTPSTTTTTPLLPLALEDGSADDKNSLLAQ